MNSLAALYELYIFESVPEEQRTPGKARWWNKLPRSRRIPYAFTRGTLLTIDATVLAIAVVIGSTTHAPLATIVSLELLYLGACTLMLLARACSRFLPAVGIYLAAMVIGIMLNLAFPDMWGSTALYMLCITLLYRFPRQWSLPLASICILMLLITNGAVPLLPIRPPNQSWTLLPILILACGLCWVGWSRRTQFLLVMKLHETQEMLREQMARGEELAAERERTRIARDIHDVLSHSLAVLSIQVQAARNLRTRDPERLAAKLDDMAALIRESITESRRVVGLLREKPPIATDDLSASLRSIASTFNERTGIHCRFAECGTPHKVSSQQRETLELALREMLTNAHRHGAAQTVWITIQWQETSITLAAHDDGLGANATQLHTLASDVMSNGPNGHHGLQGMRERAAALDGVVEAGPLESGGFRVCLRLPFAPSD